MPQVLQWLYIYVGNAAAKSLQSYPTLCDPIDGSPSGSPIPGIFQARTLKWVAISFSKAWKWKVQVTSLSRVRLLANPWTAAHQAPPSKGFSRQEYWSGVPLPSPPVRLAHMKFLLALVYWMWVFLFVEFGVCFSCCWFSTVVAEFGWALIFVLRFEVILFVRPVTL